MNPFDFPPELRTMHIATNGTTIYVRSGGTGPAVVLLHGYGETGDMWVTLFPRATRQVTLSRSQGRQVYFSSIIAGAPSRGCPPHGFLRQEGPAHPSAALLNSFELIQQ
jgi:hypothetical protein